MQNIKQQRCCLLLLALILITLKVDASCGSSGIPDGCCCLRVQTISNGAVGGSVSGWVSHCSEPILFFSDCSTDISIMIEMDTECTDQGLWSSLPSQFTIEHDAKDTRWKSTEITSNGNQLRWSMNLHREFWYAPIEEGSIVITVKDRANIKGILVHLVDSSKCSVPGKFCPNQPGFFPSKPPPNRPNIIPQALTSEQTLLAQKGLFGSRGEYKLGSVHAKFCMGTSINGRPAGNLVIDELQPSPFLASAKSLKWMGPTNSSDCDVLRDSNGSIRQVKVFEGLADIYTVNAYKYEVRMYISSAVGVKSNGIYTLTGSPIFTTTVENPLATNTNYNNITFTDEGRSTAFTWLGIGWEMRRGEGADLVRNYREDVWNSNNSNCTTKVEIRDASGNLSECYNWTMHTNQYGIHLINIVKGAASDSITNSYTHAWSTNKSSKWSYLDNELWNYDEYDAKGRLTKHIEPLMNQAPSTNALNLRVIDYYYTSNAVAGAGMQDDYQPQRARCIVESQFGQETKRSYSILSSNKEIIVVCNTAGASWNASDNTVRTNWFVEAFGPFQGLIRRIDHMNGTLEIKAYENFTVGTVKSKITTLVGKPDTYGTNVIDGLRTVEELGWCGEVLKREKRDIVTNIVLSRETMSLFDNQRRPQKVAYLDGTTEEFQYGCCGVDIHRDRTGSVTLYSRDSGGRIIAENSEGVALTNILSPSGRVIKDMLIGTNGSTLQLGAYAYNSGGDTVNYTNASAASLQFYRTATNGSAIERMINNANAEKTVKYFKDGRIDKISGTLVVNGLRYEYGVEMDLGVYRRFSKEIKLLDNGTDSSEWVKTTFDMTDRIILISYPDGASKRFTYNNKSQLTKSVDEDGIATLYSYDDIGSLTYTALDINGNGQIDFGGLDRITQVKTIVTNAHGYDVVRQEHYAWPTNNVNAPIIKQTLERSTDGSRMWSQNDDGLTTVVRSVPTNNFVTITETEPGGRTEEVRYEKGKITSVSIFDANGGRILKNTFLYDVFGRQCGSVSDSGLTNMASLRADGNLTSSILMGTGSGLSQMYTTYDYDPLGRQKTAISSDGIGYTNTYTANGLIAAEFGNQRHLISYNYGIHGRVTGISTFTNVMLNSPSNLTVWQYDGSRGFLTNKTFVDGSQIGYLKSRSGVTLKKQNARGSVITYVTNRIGEIENVIYSDSLTPNVTNTYNREGFQTSLAFGASIVNRELDSHGIMNVESNSAGILVGWNVIRKRNAMNLVTNIVVRYLTNTVCSFNQSYDSASRLSFCEWGSRTATLEYDSDSRLLKGITWYKAANATLQQLVAYDALGRRKAEKFGFGSNVGILAQYNYNYDIRNNVTRSEDLDGSSWYYEYSAKSECLTANRYWPNREVVMGMQLRYSYDAIGNRLSSFRGGDSNGNGLRETTYGVNGLNQYNTVSWPGFIDVCGAARVDAVVSVNGTSAARQGEYFRSEIGLTASTNIGVVAVTNIATLVGVGMTNLGSALILKGQLAISYDLDGNMTSDGLWNYSWDAENRLVEMQSRMGVPDSQKLLIKFAYDPIGRRIQKRTFKWLSGAYGNIPHVDIRYIYDNWDVIAEIDASNNLVRAYQWAAPDIDRDANYANSVVPLRIYDKLSNTYWTPVVDRIGNVRCLVNEDNGVVEAVYEYGPYGELLRSTGNASSSNVVRYGCKFVDPETDLVYYGTRYYSSALGRWLSRDSIEELDNKNLYAFVNNNPVNSFDVLGMWATDVHHVIVDDWLFDIRYVSYPWRCCCTLDVRKLIKQGSDEVDGELGSIALDLVYTKFYEAQATKNAYQHAMRAPGELISSASAKYEKFIADNVAEARLLANEARTAICFTENISFKPVACPLVSKALVKLGYAYHAFSDSLSPAHKGFQPWWGPLAGPERLGVDYYAKYIFNHKAKETMSIYLQPQMQSSIENAVRSKFQSTLDEILAR